MSRIKAKNEQKSISEWLNLSMVFAIIQNKEHNMLETK